MANHRAPTTATALPARFLTPEDIASLLCVPLETVYQWRRKRTGPPGFRAGRHVRYHPDAVAQWVTDQTHQAA
ncbi:helix-turn-helix transcriptional regulator [Kitasatospora purpeofusca]|uniref:helix-turn-helix transcriptional regulator n=1 Tax=Kitasatospora purpeofusca TaxID=67352 RepID=UPI0004BE4F39|nr:helix-turn-helix domain-containing protein [Kitasatospora purpeofusca]